MNTIYNVVWNSTTNTWVVASEMAKGRKKASRRSTTALAIAGMAVSSVVVAHPDVDVPGEPGLEICQNGANNGINTAGCALGADGFGLFTTFGAGFTSGEPAFITGKQTGELTLHGQKGITMMDDVLMSGKHIRGLAPGVVAPGSTDAVTGDQLYSVFNSGTKYFKANVLEPNAEAAAIAVDSTAMGARATATGYRSVAFGVDSASKEHGSLAGGLRAAASGVHDVAIGADAAAASGVTSKDSKDAATFGNLAATAVGSKSAATAQHATAIGAKAQATAAESLAVGGAANASGANAVALGAQTTSTGLRAVAVGFGAKALDVDATAFGNNAEARSVDSTAIGDSSKATEFGAQSIGTWSAASGKQATAIGYFATAQGNSSTALGLSAKATGDDATAMGTLSAATATNAIALGSQAVASASQATAVGYSATAQGLQSASFGERAAADADYSVAVGSEAQAQGKYATAIGVLTKAGQQSLALGDSAQSSALQAVSIGSLSRANSDFAVAIGADSEAAASGTAIGRQSKASANSVALGAGSVADRDRSVSVGVAGSERQITNLAKGTADTDGVNVSQLKGVTTAIGAGSTVNPDGSIKAPEFNVGGKTVNNVGEAIDGLDNIVSESGLIDPATGKAQKAVTFNGPNGEANVAGQKIINVAAGTADTDAVNVKQIKDSGLIDPSTGKVQKAVLFNGPNGEANSAGQKFINLAKGTADTDGVNMSQLKGVTDVIGAGAGINPDGTVKSPEFTVGDKKVGTVGEAIDGLDGIVKESGLVDPATGKAQKAVLFNGPNGEANVAGTKIVNVGDGALSANSKDAVNGSQLFATNQNVGAVQNTVNNITNGAGIKYFHTNSKLADSQAGGTDAIAVGGGASAGANRGIAIGTNANASAENSIALGTNSIGDRANSISLGSASNQRQIINLAKGTADTDAVNVSQLKGVTDAIGGGAGVNPDGTVKKPTITVGGSDYDNVGAAIAAVDAKAGTGNPLGVNYDSAAKDKLTLNNGGAPVTVGNVKDGVADNDAVNVKQLKETGLIDPETGEAQKAVLFNGPNGEANVAGTKIVNVAEGTVSAASKDAINGSQLFGTATSVAKAIGGGSTVNPDGTVKAPEFTVGGKKVDNVGSAIDGLDKIATESGLVDPTTGKAQKAVLFNGPNGEANVAGTKIVNVAAGTANTDAVNVSQLKGVTDVIGAGAGVNPDGTIKKPTISVGGKDFGTIGEAISAVDAKAATGNPLGVAYDSASKDKVTLNNGGAPVTIGNVKDGVANNDAVNVKQLKETGLIDPETGEAQKAVLFNGPNGEANVAGTKIVNVAAGTANTDAVNIGQLKPVVDGLGGGAKIDPTTGAVTGPTYVITRPDGSTTTVNNAGDAITNVDGRVTNITNNISNGTVGLVQQAAKGQRLTVGKATDGTEVNFTGTAGDRKLTGVAKGTADTDAVNVSQLKGTGLIDPTTGEAQKAVLFNGPNGAANVAGTKIVNVAAGTANTDGVNVSQLKGVTDVIGAGAGINADGTVKKPTINVGGKDFGTIGEAIAAVDAKAVTGNPLGVAYDSTAKDKVTLNNGGAPVTISNVKEGVADNDAVNVKQLKDTGLIDPETGEAQKAVLFNGPNGEANVAGTKIVNVAAGTVSAASTDAINGSQLFGTAQSVAKAIGGGSVVNPDGTVKAPEFTVGGKKVDNVGSAIDGLDNIVKESGLIDPETGAAQKAVLFNGPNGAANVAGTRIVNVAAGTGNTDAVNIAQLKPVIDGLGGGAKIDPTTGAVTGPTYVITNPDGSTTTVNNAGDAITNVTNNISNGTVGLVQQAAKGQRLTVGKATDGTEVNFTGTAGDRKLTGVAKGTADTDAVNVSQLKDTGLIDPTTGKAQKAVLFNGPSGEANVAGTKIVNVGAGAVNATSTDAINGSQLFGVSKSVSESLGGGSKVNPDGSISGPTYVITKADGSTTTVNNVGDAITNITNNISSGTVGLVQQAAKGEKLTVGKATDGREVDFTGTAGDRKLSGVANGTAGNHAVNVSQLKPVVDGLGGGAKIDPTTGAVTGPTYVVTNPDGTTTTVNNAGDAITNIDGRVTNITNNISNGTVGLVQQAGKGQKLTVGKVTDGSEVNFAGTAGDRKLTGVAKGTADTDAVNVSQLKGTGLVDPVTGEALKAVTFNGPNGEANVAGQKIINVAAGTVDADSKDAINGGQLFGTAQSVAGALGGGSKVNPDGTISNPTYTVHKADGSATTVNNVGDAISNVDGRVTNITNTINSGGIGLVQQAGKGAKLTVGKDTDGSEVNFTGTAGDRKLSGVAKGTADNDAVNVSQLKEAGLVDGDGKVANVVTYDSADKDSITLGGKGAGKKVKVKNVADATADDEAVNLGQLKGTGLVDGNGKALDAVVYDANSQKGAVTFGGANGTVLNNVADGRIETGSRQAINGGQIAALKDQLQGHITNIDGRVTKIEQNGGIGGTPDFVKAQGAAEPAPRGEPAAVAAENGAALGYNATAGAKGATAVGDGAKAMAADGVAVGSKARVEEPATNSVALGSGSVADRANTVSVGSAGQARAITNVAAGTADHDAVNVTQLNQRLADANRYTDKAIDDVWNNLTHEIDEANTQANRGIAAASALINVTPYLPGRTAVNAGVASYRGETALGVGVSRWSENGRVNLNAGVSAAQGDEPVFRVGVGYVF